MALEAFDPINLFRLSAARWPERQALVVDERSYTYREIDRWSDLIAGALVGHDAARQRIAFVARKEAASYACMLGILKSGGSFVPLSPEGPEARWKAILHQAGVRSVLGTHAGITGLTCIPVPAVDEGPATQIPLQGTDPSEAYVLFTSGSTGGPKGVAVTRSNLAAYLGHMLPTYGISEQDRCTQLFALTFDLSMHDLFVTWGSGACLVVPPVDVALRASAFIREQGITTWFSVPAFPALMQRMRGLTPGSLPSLRYAFFCGEALPWSVVRAFAMAAPEARIINLYGPTEATIAITSYEVDRREMPTDGIVPIGKPFPRHVATLEGEQLVLAGPQVTAGYVNDAVGTERAFIRFPGAAGYGYRTGDRVRVDDQGNLHFLGRVDDQVKVLGHRVEPAEVDSVVRAGLNGGGCATVAVTGRTSTRLCTFIDMPADTTRLLELCRTHLPAYMVPERIIVLETLPLTVHGKVDRKRLIELAKHDEL